MIILLKYSRQQTIHNSQYCKISSALKEEYELVKYKKWTRDISNL